MTVASAVGSMPGDDQAAYDEAVRTVLGELPDLPHLPEVPGRGAIAGMTGRAVVTTSGDPVDRVDVELLDPAYGIAPGQAAVIYDGTRVVGSATIAATERVTA